MKIKYIEAINAITHLSALRGRKLSRNLTVAVVRNEPKLKKVAGEYQEIHTKLVDDATVRGDDDSPAYPTVTDPETGEEVEDRSGDPLFDDKEALVADINELRVTEVEIPGVHTVTLDDLPEEIEPELLKALSFMISDLFSPDEE